MSPTVEPVTTRPLGRQKKKKKKKIYLPN